MLAVLTGAQSAFGFALIGPPLTTGTPDAFQVQLIGYNLQNAEDGTPKMIGQEYRRNTPVLYWAYDESFWRYFNTNGVAAVQQAFDMYNSVGKVSQLDPNDYPEDSRRVNFQAQALLLFDLKSAVAGFLTREVGLYQPTRWVWGLSTRQQLTPPVPPCPFNMEYTVIQRNYSIVPVGINDYPSTSYVNGVLYSYFIDDACQGAAPADAVEFPVDPLSQPYSAVADYASATYSGLSVGTFYTSLTRDDVAGLKYIYATNNFNTEPAGDRVTEYVTNDAPQIVTTQDLNALATAASVSSAATLQAQFPGLQILATSNYFGLQVTTNITEILVNSPLDPAGAPPSHPIISTNFTTNVVQFFSHTFGNIITNTYATRGIVGTVTQTITNSPFAPAGAPPTTNTTVKFTTQKGVFGDFFILPTNQCSALILSNFLTTVTVVTNLPIVTSNAAAGGTATITFTPGSVTFQTNNTVIYLPVTCPTNAVAMRGGMDQIHFVARPFDFVTSQLWDPVTNNYILTEFDQTNGVYVERHFSRRVPRPDFLFTAANFSGAGTVVYSNTVDNSQYTLTITLGANNTALEVDDFTLGTGGRGPIPQNTSFDQSARPSNQAGPGTIVNDPVGPRHYVFNSQLPLLENLSATSGTTNTFLDPSQADSTSVSAWASFDGSTNAPVVYPNGTSLLELQNAMVGPVPATPTLPDANIGVNYSVQLAAKNGTAPYTWSLAPNSPALPNGLNISSDGKITGIPSGPASIYDFTVRITDAAGRTRDIQYTITVF